MDPLFYFYFISFEIVSISSTSVTHGEMIIVWNWR